MHCKSLCQRASQKSADALAGIHPVPKNLHSGALDTLVLTVVYFCFKELSMDEIHEVTLRVYHLSVSSLMWLLRVDTECTHASVEGSDLDDY